MKKIAVLGANGFLGAPVCNAFRKIDWEVIEISRSGGSVSGNTQTKLDLFDEEGLSQFLSSVRPDVVISTAWETEHGKFWTKETNNHYQVATMRFAEKCFEKGVTKFVGLGTMSEYGSSPGKCNALYTPLSPSDLYSEKKAETGLQLKELGKAYGREIRWLRIFQAFGPNEKPQRFIPGLIRALRANENFSIRTPDYFLDWIHSEDVASAIAFSVLHQVDDLVDVGTGVETSVKEVSEMLCRIHNLDASLLDYSEQVPGHGKSIYVDPLSGIFQEGWSPEKSLALRLESLR